MIIETFNNKKLKVSLNDRYFSPVEVAILPPSILMSISPFLPPSHLFSMTTEFKSNFLWKGGIEVHSSLLGKFHTKFVTILK